MKRFFQKLILYAGLSEMRLFWFFLLFLIILLAINYFYLSYQWFLVSSGIFLILAAIIFTNGLRLAQSNLEVKVERNELKSIISNLQDAVIAYDPDFKILIFNHLAEVIFNLKSEEVIGMAFNPTFTKEARFALLTRVIFPSLAPVAIQHRDPSIFPQITDLSFDDPELKLRVATDKIIDPNGRLLGFVKIIHDKTREVELAKSKSEFITVAAHQLRSPLSGVHWAFETLAKENLTKEQKEIVEGGLSATIKLLRIVNDLLDVSRIEEGRFGYKFENINIIDFLKEVIVEAERLNSQYGIKIYLEKPEEPHIIVPIDSDKLRIALLNLLDNAVKYNVKNGQVVVSIEKVKGLPYVKISIKDTGVGIGPEEAKKLFTKFFRAEAIQKLVPDGTGLGLYIVKNIVRAHGGNVGVESELNRGSNFYFTLPIDPKLIPPKEVPVGEE